MSYIRFIFSLKIGKISCCNPNCYTYIQKYLPNAYYWIRKKIASGKSTLLKDNGKALCKDIEKLCWSEESHYLSNYSIEPSLRCRLSLGSGGIWEEYIQCEAEKYWINNGKLDLFTSVFSQSWVAFKKVSLNCWMLHHKLPTSTIWPWGLTFKNISTSSCWFDLTFYLLNSPKVPCSEHKKDCG